MAGVKLVEVLENEEGTFIMTLSRVAIAVLLSLLGTKGAMREALLDQCQCQCQRQRQ